MLEQYKKHSDGELEAEWQKYFKQTLPRHLPKKTPVTHLWYRMQEAKEGGQKLRVKKLNSPNTTQAPGSFENTKGINMKSPF